MPTAPRSVHPNSGQPTSAGKAPTGRAAVPAPQGKGKADRSKASASKDAPADAPAPRGTIPITADSRDDNRWMMKLVIGSVGALLLLVIANICLIWYAIQQKVEVVAMTEKGEYMRSPPLDEAFVTDSRVLSFVTECLRDSFSHDFANYRQTMNTAKACYTTPGAQQFEKVFDPTLQTIRDRRVTLSNVPEPAVISRGPFRYGGRVVWEVQDVITLYYQGAHDRYEPKLFLASLQVIRVPLSEDPRGILVNSIQLSPYVRPAN